jgi:glycosyltransferase involved in cell wall biosynthesis
MDKEKRILIIPSWYPPDGGYFFREHSEAIERTGWKTDLLVTRLVGIRKILSHGPSVLQRYGVSEEGRLRVARSVYLKWPGSERRNIRGWARKTARMYSRYEKQYGKPGMILAHSVTWAGYAAYLIGNEHGIPYLIVEHRSFFVWNTESARLMVKPFHIPFFKKAFTHCQKLVLVSNSQRKGIEALVPSAVKRIVVIPNMIREDMFLPPEKPRGGDPFTFIWAGRLEHVKGLDLLLEAVNLLVERSNRDFSVRLAGKGSLREELELRAKKLGIADWVVFLGRLSRDEMQLEMQGADCFVLPSRYEAFGVVLIEAMATGLPVIATRSGGPDTLVNRETGLLVGCEDVEGLAGAMEEIMDHVDNYPGEKIRTLTLSRFGESRVMEQYSRLFHRLTGELHGH